jgi:hypothetical protein
MSHGPSGGATRIAEPRRACLIVITGEGYPEAAEITSSWSPYGHQVDEKQHPQTTLLRKPNLLRWLDQSADVQRGPVAKRGGALAGLAIASPSILRSRPERGVIDPIRGEFPAAPLPECPPLSTSTVPTEIYADPMYPSRT